MVEEFRVNDIVYVMEPKKDDQCWITPHELEKLYEGVYTIRTRLVDNDLLLYENMYPNRITKFGIYYLTDTYSFNPNAHNTSFSGKWFKRFVEYKSGDKVNIDNILDEEYFIRSVPYPNDTLIEYRDIYVLTNTPNRYTGRRLSYIERIDKNYRTDMDGFKTNDKDWKDGLKWF